MCRCWPCESVKKRAQVGRDMTGPKVCVSLEGTTVKEMADEAARANISGADMVEVRFDRLYLKKPAAEPVEDENGDIKHVMPPEDDWVVKELSDVNIKDSIEALKESIPLPVIFSVRPTSEGGRFPGSEDERIAILHAAIESGVTSIDVEMSTNGRDAIKEAASKSNVNIISSIHDVETTPSADELVAMVKEHAIEGEIFKFCGTVNDHQDALQIVEACHELKDSKMSFALMALGNGGDWARLHAPVLGQDLVYATLRSEFKLSNKGLVNVKDLRSAWILMEY